MTQAYKKHKRKQLFKRFRAIVILFLVLIGINSLSKYGKPKLMGYTYDSGNTVWEMAEKYCPENMDIRELIAEIESLNGIKNSTVYADSVYKIPIYE